VVKCSDSCSYAPTVTCMPLAAGDFLISAIGNASYIGLDTWTGNLPASLTGSEVLQADNSTRVFLSFGGRATFRCSKGSISSGNVSQCTRNLHIDALADGTLRGLDQYCRRIVCDGGTIAHAKHIAPHFIELGKNGTVTCDDGYRVGLKGQDYASCRNGTNYTVTCAGCSLEAELECLPVRCDASRSIATENATLSVIDATLSLDQSIFNIVFPQIIGVTCNSGYRIGTNDVQGPNVANGTCTQRCELSRNLTCLPVWCNTSALPGINSVWSSTESGAGGMYYGDTAKIRCNDGYSAAPGSCDRSFMVGCLSDGSIWNSNRICNNSIQCTAADDSNAIISSNLTVSGAQSFGSVTTVKCNLGYGARMRPSTYAPCGSPTNYSASCSHNCTFVGTEACVPYRCSLSDLASALSGKGVSNHSLRSAYAYFGDTVEIMCNTGYVFGSETSGIKAVNAICSEYICGSFGVKAHSSLCVQLKCNLTKLVRKHPEIYLSCSLLWS